MKYRVYLADGSTKVIVGMGITDALKLANISSERVQFFVPLR